MGIEKMQNNMMSPKELENQLSDDQKGNKIKSSKNIKYINKTRRVKKTSLLSKLIAKLKRNSKTNYWIF
jgi:hypothetical protein